VVIVGGGIAAVSTASALRALGFDGPVTLILGVGMVPDTGLAAAAGLLVDRGVVVDTFQGSGASTLRV